MLYKIFIFILITYTSFSQNQFSNYLDFINNGRNFQNKKNYDLANREYIKAFNVKDISTINFSIYFECALNFHNLNNEKKANKYIIKSIVDGGATRNDLLNYWSMKPFQNKTYFKSILENYGKYRIQYLTKLKNIDTFFEIEKLNVKDELIREINTLSWEQISKIDNENIDRVIDITKEFGWHDNAWMILWHQRGTYLQKNKIWNFFKPFIDNEIINGKMSPAFWAMYEDDTEVAKSGNSIYGTTYGKVDPKTVNIYRAKVHLPLLTEKQIDTINKEAEEISK